MKMKYTLLCLCIIAFTQLGLLHCSSPTPQTTSNTTPPASIVETPPSKSKGELLIEYNDCKTCHNSSQKIIGPSYQDIAKKYAQADQKKITKLANTIIKGGKGNWGTVAMTPHAQLDINDAQEMVTYILSLQH